LKKGINTECVYNKQNTKQTPFAIELKLTLRRNTQLQPIQIFKLLLLAEKI